MNSVFLESAVANVVFPGFVCVWGWGGAGDKGITQTAHFISVFTDCARQPGGVQGCYMVHTNVHSERLGVAGSSTYKSKYPKITKY